MFSSVVCRHFYIWSLISLILLDKQELYVDYKFIVFVFIDSVKYEMKLKVIINLIASVSSSIVRFDPLLDVSFKQVNGDGYFLMLTSLTSV